MRSFAEVKFNAIVSSSSLSWSTSHTNHRHYHFILSLSPSLTLFPSQIFCSSLSLLRLFYKWRGRKCVLQQDVTGYEYWSAVSFSTIQLLFGNSKLIYKCFMETNFEKREREWWWWSTGSVICCVHLPKRFPLSSSEWVSEWERMILSITNSCTHYFRNKLFNNNFMPLK